MRYEVWLQACFNNTPVATTAPVCHGVMQVHLVLSSRLSLVIMLLLLQGSVLHAVGLMQQLGLRPGSSAVYFGQLLGMADHLTFTLGANGYPAFKYVPYGRVHEVRCECYAAMETCLEAASACCDAAYRFIYFGNMKVHAAHTGFAGSAILAEASTRKRVNSHWRKSRLAAAAGGAAATSRTRQRQASFCKAYIVALLLPVIRCSKRLSGCHMLVVKSACRQKRWRRTRCKWVNSKQIKLQARLRALC